MINTISGTRRSGKTSILVQSAAGHLVDPTLEDCKMLFVVHSVLEARRVAELVLAQVKKHTSEWRFSRSGLNKISVGSNSIEFSSPSSHSLVGKQVDRLFLDQVDYMPEEFTTFVDTYVRPNVVVIQTETTDL